LEILRPAFITGIADIRLVGGAEITDCNNEFSPLPFVLLKEDIDGRKDLKSADSIIIGNLSAKLP